MMSVQNKMFERAEGGVSLARVRRFARAPHVENQAGIGEVFGDVNHALQFVHGFDAADAFDFGDRERRAAFASRAEVAARGCMERSQRQTMLREGAGDGLDFLPGGVVEMAASGENFEGFETGFGNLAEKFGGQPSRYEHIGGENSSHS